MTKRKASSRGRLNPFWEAVLTGCQAGLEEYFRIHGPGQRWNISAMLEFIRTFAPPVLDRAAPFPESALIGRVSDETMKKIHRLVVQDLHPDKGGDPEAMKRANAAWEEIKRRRGMQ